MRIATSSRAQSLIEHVRRPSLYSLAELALIALIAVQLARLFWVLVTPLGPVGDWRAPSSLTAPPPTARLGDFDPFFRLAGAPGQLGVTGLNLRLFGVGEDRATGYWVAHSVLIVVNLGIAAVLGRLGVKAWRATGSRSTEQLDRV